MTGSAAQAQSSDIRPEQDITGSASAAGDLARPRLAAAAIAHGVVADQAAYYAKKPSTLEYLMHAQRRSGRGGMELARDYFGLHRGRGKLSFQEYVQYGVYNGYTRDQQSRFLSQSLHWPLTQLCCDMTWQAATED